MKFKVSGVDKSDNIFSIDGFEYRQNVGGGYVINEFEFNTNVDIDTDQVISIEDDNGASLGYYMISFAYYNNNIKLFQYKAKDILSNLQNINADDRNISDWNEGYFGYTPQIWKYEINWSKDSDDNDVPELRTPLTRAYKIKDMIKYYIYLALKDIPEINFGEENVIFLFNNYRTHYDGECMNFTAPYANLPALTPRNIKYRSYISAYVDDLWVNHRRMNHDRSNFTSPDTDRCWSEDRVSLLNAINNILISMNWVMYWYGGCVYIDKAPLNWSNFDDNTINAEDYEPMSRYDTIKYTESYNSQSGFKNWMNKEYQYPYYYYNSDNTIRYEYSEGNSTSLEELTYIEICPAFKAIDGSNNPFNMTVGGLYANTYFMMMTKGSGDDLGNNTVDYEWEDFGHTGTPWPLIVRERGYFTNNGTTWVVDNNLKPNVTQYNSNWFMYNAYQYYKRVGSKNKIGWGSMGLLSLQKRTTELSTTSLWEESCNIPLSISYNFESKTTTIEEIN